MIQKTSKKQYYQTLNYENLLDYEELTLTTNPGVKRENFNPDFYSYSDYDDIIDN